MNPTKLKAYLQATAAQIQVDLNPVQLDQFYAYMTLMIHHNKHMNLTAITDPHEVILKHFVDSLLGLSLMKERIIDVGTGAGLPGIPLAIAMPEGQFSLLDPLNKRIHFLNEVVAELGLKNITTLPLRSEDAGHDPTHREQYHIATSRGVAALHKLAEYCLPFVKVGGQFVAYKGQKAPDEIEEGRKAIELLGGEVVQHQVVNLPVSEEPRHLVVIKKVRACEGKYPRKPNQIKNSPLVAPR